MFSPQRHLTPAIALCSALVFAACGSDNESATSSTDQTTAATTATSAETTAPPTTSTPTTAAVDTSSASWAQDAGSLQPAERNGLYASVGAPPVTIQASTTYEAVISTADGDMRFRLFGDEAPITVNNFVSLANDGFFDGITFHRVLAGFMAQGGDPAGDGRGGPGYTFENEYTPGIEFGPIGQIAMANAGPDTNGSQFFLTFDGADFLEASQFTIFGELVAGQEVLMSIDLRDPNAGGPPGELITSVVIEES